MKLKRAELFLSLAVLVLGAAVAMGTAALPAHGGYAGVGPNAAPAAVAAGLILLGIRLLYEALTGGWRNGVPDRAAQRGEHDFHTGAFLWVTAGLFAQILLIQRAGFVVAQTVLFACVARGFGSTRAARDLGVGLALAVAVFLFFVKFLNVSLPPGWLKPILGTAGI
ncbi:MAG TPA: tripartite tricarboxylate transporter TctB family protein [candidate division Zixibacteria bacterium]|nr:tripartite tricarboxylate transporter TctB family protein [candidate division Zixibacteria bacterium]